MLSNRPKAPNHWLALFGYFALAFYAAAWLPLRAGQCAPPTGPPEAAVRTEVYGTSVRRRPLVAWIFGRGSDVTMIFGGFHGNEPQGTAVVDDLIHTLRTHPDLLVRHTVLLVPRANPDGLAVHSRWNAHRVDLNRNFPEGWQPASRHSRGNSGAYTGSEPESSAIMTLVRRYHPAKVISIHSPLNCMNWTGSAGYRLAVLMRRYNHYRITPDIGYPTPGSFGMYCGKLGIAIVTLELPAENSSEAWAQNREALLAAIHAVGIGPGS
ncbi:MAG: DUF2817 domain-containing protein [Chloroflexi bacterium]|nr:DUF2817 domain-containing protein [Chloroflexota bacterium]